MDYHKIYFRNKFFLTDYRTVEHALVSIENGFGHLILNGVLIEVQNNSCIILPKKSLVSCSINNTNNENIILTIFTIDNESLASTLTQLQNVKCAHYPYLKAINLPLKIKENFSILQESEKKINCAKIRERLMYQCLFFILKELNECGINVFSVLNTMQEPFNTQTIVQCILSDPQEKWSLTEMSKRLNISTASLRGHLTSKDISFSKLLLDTRMEIACRYLKSTKYSTLKISYLVGFKSSSYFCQMFKIKYGEPPQSFRKVQAKQSNPAKYI